MAKTKVKFLRGSSEPQMPDIFDGQIVYTTDTHKMYVDAGMLRGIINPNPDWDAADGNSKILNKPFVVTKSIEDNEEVFDVTFI